jgi:hypothetical protein
VKISNIQSSNVEQQQVLLVSSLPIKSLLTSSATLHIDLHIVNKTGALPQPPKLVFAAY